MKVNIEVLKKVELDVCKMKVDAGVRYWQDSKIDGVRDNDCEEEGSSPIMPCSEYVGEKNSYLRGENWRWKPIINIDEGKIENWCVGKTADIHYKVCDDFICNVLDCNGDVVCEYYNYVPRIMCPAGNGYGDYIIMHIDENGFIEGWNKELIYELFND